MFDCLILARALFHFMLLRNRSQNFVLLQLAFNLDYDLVQAVEILDQLIQNWEHVTSHVRDSRRVAAYRSHFQEVSLFICFLIG